MISYNKLLKAGFNKRIREKEAADRQLDEPSQISFTILIWFQFLIYNIYLLYTQTISEIVEVFQLATQPNCKFQSSVFSKNIVVDRKNSDVRDLIWQKGKAHK